MQIEFSQVVQAKTDSEGGEVSPDQLWKIFEDEYLPASNNSWGRFTFDSIAQSSQTGKDVSLTVELTDAGKKETLTGTGNGPIAAFVEIMNSHLGKTPVRVLDYYEHALSSGGDASAAAYLECEVGGKTYWGVGIDPSTTTASLKAVVSAVNRGLGK